MEDTSPCLSISSGLRSISSSELNPDVPRSSVLTRPPRKEKGRERQRPGWGAGVQPGPGCSPRGPLPALQEVRTRLPGRRACAEPRWVGPSPRTGRRGAATECHRKWPLVHELHCKVMPSAAFLSVYKVSICKCISVTAPPKWSTERMGSGMSPARCTRGSPGEELTLAPRSGCDALWLFKGSDLLCVYRSSN